MSRADTTDRWWRWGLGALGAATLANAAWMLAAPADWYHDLPAAVPDTGPLNPHFVRDVGSAFMLVGVALVWAAFRPALRVPFLALSAVFLVLHALVHVTDTLAGRLPSSHWLVDLPGVYLPAVVVLALTLAAARRERAGSGALRTR